MKNKTPFNLKCFALAISSVLPSVAVAFPVAISGTEGFSVIVNSTDNIIATYQGNSAGYSNDLLLDILGTPFIFNNHASPVGSTVNLGSFAIGTELIFRLRVNNTGDNFFTGAASRNPDGHTHARVQNNWSVNETLVSFEDLYGGAYVYNDLSFSFTNTSATSSVPAPAIISLIGLGLAGIIRQRKKTINSNT